MGSQTINTVGNWLINSIKIILKDDSKNISDGLWLRKSVSIWGGGEEEAILNEDKASKINVKQNLAKLGNYTNITQYANRGYSICVFTLLLMLAFFLACRHAKIFPIQIKISPREIQILLATLCIYTLIHSKVFPFS